MRKIMFGIALVAILATVGYVSKRYVFTETELVEVTAPPPAAKKPTKAEQAAAKIEACLAQRMDKADECCTHLKGSARRACERSLDKMLDAALK